MIKTPQIQLGELVATPDLVWYILLLFSASAHTDTEWKSFDCALVFTFEFHVDLENGNFSHDYVNYIHYSRYLYLINVIHYLIILIIL